MTEFDDKIRQALRTESDNVWTAAEEQGLFEQALGVMRGRQKLLTAFAYADATRVGGQPPLLQTCDIDAEDVVQDADG